MVQFLLHKIFIIVIITSSVHHAGIIHHCIVLRTLSTHIKATGHCKAFLNQARAWYLDIDLVREVCVCVCVCLCVRP